MSGRDLRAARVAMGLSPEAMAELMRIDVEMLTAWERGDYPMPKLAVEVLKMVKQPSLF